MENQKKKYDLIIPLGTGSSWDNNELRYALRSYEKNFPNLGNVFIVGDAAWIKKNLPWLKATIVDCNDPFNANKDANMIRKVIKVIDTQELSDEFVRATDDQFILKKVESFPPMYTYNLKDKDPGWWGRGSRWKNRLKRTYRILSVHKKTTFNYDGHFPMTYKKDFKKVMESYPYTKSIGYTINTLYFNNVLTEHEHYEDIRHMFELVNDDLAVIKKKLKGKTVMCYSGRNGDACLTPALKEYLKNKFPKKSKYER